MPGGGRGAIVVISDSDDELPPKKRKLLFEEPKRQGKAPKQTQLRSDATQEARKSANQSALSSQDAPKRGRLELTSSQEDIKKGGLTLVPTQTSKANEQESKFPAKKNPRPAEHELWSEKHAPKTEGDLIVHKKRVMAVKEFLRAHAEGSNDGPVSRLMLITGPPGCGKTATVQVLAAEMGFSIKEWEAPVPTLWSEHLHQVGMQQHWESKLDAFDSFVAHAKFAPLTIAVASGKPEKKPCSTGRTLILVDDLPHVAGADQKRRLTNSLGTLAETSRSPVIVIMTGSRSHLDQRDSGSLTSPSGMHADLSRTLETAGGCELTFNAITALTAARVLKRIAEAEGVFLEASAAQAIAGACGGDLLNAIKTLQLYCYGKVDPALLRRKKARTRTQSKEKAKGPAMADAALLPLQRDVNLTSFHALGKILYNKRKGDEDDEDDQPLAAPLGAQLGAPDSPGSIGQVAAELQRREMVVNPEDVLMASGMELGSAVAFLHEHYPSFVHHDAMEDAAAAAGYFSEADRLLSHGWASTSDIPLDNVAAGSCVQDACGGSVAARGLMWANAHPAPAQWRPLSGPLWFPVRRAIQTNMLELQHLAGAEVAGSWGRGSAREVAAGLLPFLRMMSTFPAAGHAKQLLPRRWAQVWEGKLAVEDRHHQSTLPGLGDDAGALGLGEDLIEDDDADMLLG